MMMTEARNRLIVNVSLTDTIEPPGFHEVTLQGIESEQGMPEVEEKIATSGDPRLAVAEWEGVPGEIEVYPPWTEQSERSVMFIPRPGNERKFNRISFIKDLTKPDAPVQLRRKITLGEASVVPGPLKRDEIYNTEDELPAVIVASGGEPDHDYPMSPRAIRDRVERLLVDTKSGLVLSVTGDYCHIADDPEGKTDALTQSEIEFKGVVGERPVTLDDVVATVSRVSTIFGAYLADRDLDPQPTNMSKGKWLEKISKEAGIIE